MSPVLYSRSLLVIHFKYSSVLFGASLHGILPFPGKLSLSLTVSSFLFFFFFYKFIYFIYFIFGCVGSPLLRAGFLQLRRAGATPRCGARASHCGGLSCCGARALGAQASVVVAGGLQSAGSVVVAHGPSCSAACGNPPG